MLAVPVFRLDPELPLPAYAHPGDAGLDLLARQAAVIPAGGGRVLVPTGIVVAIPEGYAGFVVPRSGLALRHGIGGINTPGMIDAAYRGELKVVMLNTDPFADYQVHRGDKLITFIDTSVPSAVSEVRSIQLNSALAQDLANVLQQAIQEVTPSTPTRTRTGQTPLQFAQFGAAGF